MQAFCGNLLSLNCVFARVCLRFFMLLYSYDKHKLAYLFILNKSEPLTIGSLLTTDYFINTSGKSSLRLPLLMERMHALIDHVSMRTPPLLGSALH